jgi:hypothetical protein
VPDDDASIVDAVELFRLLNPEFDIDWDYDEHRWLVKSSAFQNTSDTDRMSVVLGDTLQKDGRTREDACRSMPDRFVVSLTAGGVRSEDQGVVRTPVADEPAHGDVVGNKKNANRRRRLRDMCTWVVEPPPRIS